MADAIKTETTTDQVTDNEDELVAVFDEPKIPDQEHDPDELDVLSGRETEEEEEPTGDQDTLQSKRREERHSRRQRQKEARERDKRELEFLRSRNEQLETRFSQVESRLGATEVTTIDNNIRQLQDQIALADEVISKAVDQNKGSDLIEAQRIREQLVDNLRNTQGYRQRLTQPKPQTSHQPDPRLLSHAQKWMEKNPWWDPRGGDEDSLIVSSLDTSLVRSGYDPTTVEYWDKLTEKVQDRLPHRFDGGGRDNAKKSQGPTFTTGGRERPLKKNEVYISSDRRQAMEEAGVWDDPKLRNRYLKQYAEYDKRQKTNT